MSNKETSIPIQMPTRNTETPICSICKRRPATKQCDFPISRAGYFGHPPRNLMDQAKHTDTAWLDLNMSWTETCDKYLCDRCSISMGSQIDFCPTHIQDMQAHIKKEK